MTVNRRDLLAIPVPDANLLWRDLRVRDVQRVEGRPQTSNIRIDLIVEGVSNDRYWKCGLEFDYANDESFYCRPLRVSDGKTPARMPVPKEAGYAHIAFLPPMSGLAATETKIDSAPSVSASGKGERPRFYVTSACRFTTRIGRSGPSWWYRFGVVWS